jgi:hypothetical protein
MKDFIFLKHNEMIEAMEKKFKDPNYPIAKRYRLAIAIQRQTKRLDIESGRRITPYKDD